MDTKRSAVAAIVGAVVLYVGGYVIVTGWFGSFYAANAGSATGVTREPQILWAMLLGSLAYASLITYVIGRAAGPTSVREGARTGATVGFLVWLTVNMIFFGSTNMNTVTIAIVAPLLELVRGGIVGAVIGGILAGKAGSSTA